jgi:hypothetical protein
MKLRLTHGPQHPNLSRFRAGQCQEFIHSGPGLGQHASVDRVQPIGDPGARSRLALQTH